MELRKCGPRRAGALVLLAAGALNGCYAYAPVGTGDPLTQRDRVRLDLRSPTDVRLSQVTANDAVAVFGEVAAHDSSALSISVLRAVSANGYTSLGGGETVRFERSNVAGVSRSRLAVGRTLGFAAAIAALGTLVGTALSDPGGGGSGGGGGGAEQ